MKIFVPPIVAIILTMIFDKLIDLALGIGPYEDANTPGIVFLIEAILIVSFSIFGFLFHYFVILRIVENRGEKGYNVALMWGLLPILLISLFYIIFISPELKFSLSIRIGNVLRLFFTMLFILIADLFALKMITKMNASCR